MLDGRIADNGRPWLRIVIMWALVASMLIGFGWGSIRDQVFPDPDDVLRLVQVRDLLAGQAWFDLTQYRINPAAPVPMHWSRLVDLPLALAMTMLAPLVGQGLAEQITLIGVPLLTLLVAMGFIGRIAWRMFDVETAGLTCLAIGFMPVLLFQFQPLRIDHHGWQIAMVAAATWAVMLRTGWQGGILAGLAMAAGTTVSIELLPVAAIFGGVFALRWLHAHAQRAGLVGYLASFAIGLGVLQLATRGLGDPRAYCDVVTTAHVGLFATIAAAVWPLSLASSLPRPAIVAGLLVAGLAGIAVFAAASPGCLGTPFGTLDPVVRDFWYVNVREGLPFWRQSPDVVPALVPVLFGLGVSFRLWHTGRGKARSWWFEYSVLLAGTTVLGLLVWRSMAFAALLAALPLGHLLTRGLAQLRGHRSTLRKLAIAAGLVVVLSPTVPFGLARQLAQDANRPAGGNAGKHMSTCDLVGSARKLARLDPATIFAPLDIGPSILQYSSHAVVATGHHRAEAAMKDVILAFTGTPDEARALIARHRAAYVVFCADLAEPAIYVARGATSAGGNPASFAAALRDGAAPPWLEPVKLDVPESFRVWRVRRDGTSAPPR